MRHINEIVVHTTATPIDWRPGDTSQGRVNAVRDWHVNGRRWSDIGYHWLIDRDGTVIAGRPVERTGAHVAGRNTNTIGIALFGGHGGNKDDRFEDHYTPAQDRALRDLIASLQTRFGPGLHLSGHHEYANKACPCFDVRSWWAQGPALDTGTDADTAHKARLVETMEQITADIDAALSEGWRKDLPLDIADMRFSLAATKRLYKDWI